MKLKHLLKVNRGRVNEVILGDDITLKKNVATYYLKDLPTKYLGYRVVGYIDLSWGRTNLYVKLRGV